MKKITLLFLSLSGILQSQINLNSGLTACYSLNGNSIDVINSLNGTVNSVTATAGKNNIAASAYEFNGTAGSYIELPDNPLLKPNNAISVSAWVKLNSFIDDDHIIFTKNNSLSHFAAYSLITYYSSGAYRFRTYKENGSTNYAESTTTLTLNTWYHVVFTIDNTSLKIYVNSALENTVASTMNFDYQTGRSIILGGTNESNYNTPFHGSLDNLRFYNRVLNSAEVSALYSDDAACTSDVTTGIKRVSADNSVVAYPNPTTGKLYLEAGNETEPFIIFNTIGSKVKEGYTDHANVIDISSLPTGVYFLKFPSTVHGKLIKVIKE